MQIPRGSSRVLVVGGVLVAALAAVVLPASGETLTVESFRNSAVTDPAAWVAGGDGGATTGWPDSACLTAGTDTGQTPIPGCDLPAPDPEGSGALRLTPNEGGRSGFALNNQAQPNTAGLDISFHQAQFAGTIGAADGIAFFLVEGTTDLTEPGDAGGSLGYTGIDNGLIGIGLDVYGNFAVSGGSGCSDPGPGFSPDTVTIRGPGNAGVGYCWLGTSDDLSDQGIDIHGADRASSDVLVRIVFDPASAPERNVTVFLNGTQVLQVPAPQELLDAATFKFGFAAGTGAENDNHDVWDLSIQTVDPLVPAPEPEPIVLEPLFTG